MMSYGVNRGPEVVYHVPWGAADPVVSRPDLPHPMQDAAPLPVVAIDSPAPDEETPLYAASAVLDLAAPTDPILADEETPLFDAVPHYDAVVQADEERLVRTFRALPGPWQEILWFTLVEDVTVTEASVHMGRTAADADVLAGEAVTGLRRGWVADDVGAREVAPDCAAALWTLCGPDGWRGLGHVGGCDHCTDVARRLEDVLVRAPQVLLSVALAQLEGADQGQARGAFDTAV